MMYCFPNLEPVHCSMSGSNCCFLTCIQISQEAGLVVWYSHLLKNFPQFFVIHTVKGFGLVNKGEIDVFLELSCFFNDPVDVGNWISGSSAFSKFSLNIWKFWVLGSCTVVVLGLLKISLTRVYVGVTLSQTTNCYAAGLKMDQMLLKTFYNIQNT